MSLRQKLAVTVLLLVLIRVGLQEAGISLPIYIGTTYHLVQGALCGVACYSLYLEKGAKSLYPIVALVLVLFAIMLAVHLIIDY